MNLCKSEPNFSTHDEIDEIGKCLAQSAKISFVSSSSSADNAKVTLSASASLVGTGCHHPLNYSKSSGRQSSEDDGEYQK